MDKKHEILKAAFRLFCDRGYGLSMADIAAAVGLKTPSLYSHFTGKHEIIEKIIEAEVLRFYAMLEDSMEAARAQGGGAGLKMVFDAVVDYFSEYNRLRFWRSIPLIPDESVRESFGLLTFEHDKITTEKMKRLFLIGIERGEIRQDVPEGAVFLYTAMIQGVLDGMLLYPGGGRARQFAQQIYEAYWSGIRAGG